MPARLDTVHALARLRHCRGWKDALADSFAFSRVAPYFWRIRPLFTVIRPTHAEVVIPQRRGVKDLLRMVHSIVLCNGLEAGLGSTAEASIPSDNLWIPEGIEVSHTAKATTDITCIAEY